MVKDLRYSSEIKKKKPDLKYFTLYFKIQQHLICVSKGFVPATTQGCTVNSETYSPLKIKVGDD